MANEAAQNQGASEGGNNAGTTPPGDGFTPITSQDDLNKIVGERVKRAESKFADYADLQAKARRLDELEEANKTADQKTADRFAALESQLAASNAAALRSKVQATYKIDDDDAELFLTGTTAEQLEAQAKRLAERSKGPGTNYVPGEGRNPKPTVTDERATVRKLFGNG